MTKSDLVMKIADRAGITKAVAEKALNSFVSTLTEILVTEDKITLAGFGTFEVAERAQREGRNPRTGETITIPSSKVVRFKPGSKLKEVLK